jgi:ion channel-forming bestrophin family protein
MAIVMQQISVHDPPCDTATQSTLSEDMVKSRDKRADEFNLEWSGPISYESLHYFSVFPVLFSTHFVSYKLVLAPWISIMTLCTLWTYIYIILLPSPSLVSLENLQGLEILITMKGGAITFLLAFRLARAAVRFYDARLAFILDYIQYFEILNMTGHDNLFWLGRAAAGKMVEICRVVASEVLVAAPSHIAHLRLHRDMLLRWTVAFPVAVKNYLRAESGNATELAGVLCEDEVAKLFAAAHQPLHCLHMMRLLACRIIVDSPFHHDLAAAMHSDMSSSIASLTGAMGAMERINNTPLPFAYAAHVRVFLITYLCFVAVVLVPTCGWLTIPALALLSFVLLGTETAATECERPFKCRADHLPLERYCMTVSDNIAQLAAMSPPSIFST